MSETAATISTVVSVMSSRSSFVVDTKNAIDVRDGIPFPPMITENAIDVGDGIPFPPIITGNIGIPVSRVTKLIDPETRQRALLIEIDYTHVEQNDEMPSFRIIPSILQEVEPYDSGVQYLVFSVPHNDSFVPLIMDDDEVHVQLFRHFKLGTMQIDDDFVRVPEDQFLAQHPLSETVGTLKHKIAREFHVPANKQKLISVKVGVLKDNLSLAYYNVGGDDHMLFLFVTEP
ncbi:probable splicing factor 3A subunit 1 [Tanacetum coccineum]